MASIDFTTARIIVEKAMRDNKMGGTIVANGVTIDLERTWKTIVEINGQVIEIPINYQNFRDAIAKSIVDSLTALQATGQISTGPINAPNGQVVTESPNVNINAPIINLNTSTPKSAARFGDTILVDSATFLTWVTAVSTALSITPPGLITGKITSGSSTVNIGG
jgi:uncharacterized Zn-binding protein involved in type VI secretion